MEITILSLFPEYFLGPFNESIIKQAQKKGLLNINLVNIRDFSEDKHNRVDDRPYGGGPGMVLMPQPICKALSHTKNSNSKVIYLSPQGKVLTAQKCQQLAQEKHLILLCGHYEGIDERIVSQEVDEEISIGDYVLTNGGLAAIVLVDALVRFVPGVLGHERAAIEDSFQNHLLDHPHFTRPEVFNGRTVPDVLLQGNHKNIDAWRKSKAIEKTKKVRPDLYHNYLCSDYCDSQLSSKLADLRSEKIIVSVACLQKTIKFFYKFLGWDLSSKQIITKDLVIEFAEISHFKNTMDVTFNLYVSNAEILYSISKKLQGTDYLINRTSDVLLFKDPDNYLWHLKVS